MTTAPSTSARPVRPLGVPGPGVRTATDLSRDDLLRVARGGLEDFLRTLPFEDGAGLRVTMEHACLPAGKMVRPLIMLAAAAGCGADLSAVAKVAVAMEVGHSASLVHDDIIDGDRTRRGRPSVWSAYGTESALLTGDALIFAMFRAIAESGLPAATVAEAVRLVAAMGHELCSGEVLQEQATVRADLTFDTYRRVVMLKTASILRVCAELGAVVAGADDARGFLRQYGNQLGLAFQVQDDLLPYLSTHEESGKSPESDLRCRRASLPVVTAYEHGTASERRVLEAFFAAPDVDQDHRAVVEIVAGTGNLRRGTELAGQSLAAAGDALTALGDAPGVSVLREVLTALRGRTR